MAKALRLRSWYVRDLAPAPDMTIRWCDSCMETSWNKWVPPMITCSQKCSKLCGTIFALRIKKSGTSLSLLLSVSEDSSVIRSAVLQYGTRLLLFGGLPILYDSAASIRLCLLRCSMADRARQNFFPRCENIKRCSASVYGREFLTE